MSENCLQYENNDYSQVENDSARWGGGRYDGSTGGKGTGTSNISTISGN